MISLLWQYQNEEKQNQEGITEECIFLLRSQA